MVLRKKNAGVMEKLFKVLSYWKTITTIAVVAFILAWVYSALNKESEAIVGVPVIATEASALKDAPTEMIIPAKPIKVRTGEEVKRKLHLTEADVVNQDISIIAASRIKSDSHPVEVITKINKVTGETETVTVRQPLPWFEFKTSGRAGAYYGAATDLGSTVRFQAQQDLISIKAINIGIITSVDQATDLVNQPISGTRFFGGIGAEIRW